MGGLVVSSKFRRSAIVEAGMRSHFIVMSPPDFDEDTGLGTAAKPSMLRHSSRNLPLKLSSAPFCQGFPGSIRAVAILASASHARIAVLTNSGPLSERRNIGAPCTLIRRVEHLNDAGGADTSRRVDGVTFAGELVDDSEAFELLSVGTIVVDEIVGPHLVRASRG